MKNGHKRENPLLTGIREFIQDAYKLKFEDKPDYEIFKKLIDKMFLKFKPIEE